MTEIGTAMVCYENPALVFTTSEMVMAGLLGFFACWLIVLVKARREGR